MPADQNYVKTVWVNDSAPDIDATNLNKLEQGVYDAHDRLNRFFGRGTLAARPTAVSVGTEALYWATDAEVLYESDGAVWSAVTPAAITYYVKYRAHTPAAPDRNFRFVVGDSLLVDTGGINTSTPAVSFTIPKAGTYLAAAGMEIPNTQGGTAAIFLIKNDGTQLLGGRQYVGAGIDADVALHRSGPVIGPQPLPLVAGQVLKFGGYFDGGAANNSYDVWASFLRIGP